MKKITFTKTLIASLLSLSVGTVAAAPYEIIDLGTLSGDQSFGFGINSQGDTVGYANGPLVAGSDTEREFNLHGFSNVNGVNTDLGAFGTNDSYAFKINDSGLIVGYAWEQVENGGVTSLQENAVQFISTGPDKLNLGEGVFNSRAVNLNNAGQVIGYAAIDVDPDEDAQAVANRGFVYTSGTVEFFPVFGDDQTSQLNAYATAINQMGTVVGWSDYLTDTNFTGAKALIYNHSANLEELPTLGGVQSYPLDINNNNLIVGRSQDSDGFFKAFVYTIGQQELTEIPYFQSSFRDAVANAVNDNNQVVGNMLIAPITAPKYAGFIYSDGEMNLLNDMVACKSGWDLQLANDINNAGEIVGVGFFNDEIRAFKLIPTGGAIESCDDETDNSTSSGGSTTFGLMLLLGLLLGGRRKQFKI